MTPNEIVAELRRLRAAATQGEWEAKGAAIITNHSDVAYLFDNEGEDLAFGVVNADFIAFAANNAIALCAALEEQKRIADRLEEALKIEHDRLSCETDRLNLEVYVECQTCEALAEWEKLKGETR